MKRLGFAIWCGAWAACQVPNPAYHVSSDGDASVADARETDAPNSDAPSLLDAADTKPPPDGSVPPQDTAFSPSDTAVLVDAPSELASLAQGLIAHIKADEGTGTWLNDSAGGPPMEVRPVSSWVPGRTGLASDTAIKFANDGWAGTAPQAASEAVRNLRSQMSVAVWLNWASPGGFDQAISGWAGKLWYFRLGPHTYRRICVSLDLEEGRLICGTQDIPLNQWVHVAFTWDNLLLRIFVNGQLQVSQQATGTLRSYHESNLSVGALGAGGNAFAGALDDFRIYNRALLDSEVAALAR